MTDYKLVPYDPAPEMVSAAEDAYMPFGDMELALRMAILAAPAVQADYERLQADHERLQAEREKLRSLIRHAQPIIRAHAGASHMLDGFRPKRNQWDELVEGIDAAMQEVSHDN